MGVPSPVRTPTSLRVGNFEGDRKSSALAQVKPTKLVWEGMDFALQALQAQDFALLVCTFLGGPGVAWSLAAACKAFHQAVEEAWGDLVRRFPCRLYVVGGLDNGFRAVDTAWRYDPTQGMWEALPPLEAPTAGPCVAVGAGRVYVLGGENSGRALSDAQRFDPWMGCWEKLPPMTQGRIRSAAVSSGGYLYVLGGLDGSKPLNTAERFNPLTQTWEALPPMNRPRYACAAAVQGSKIVAFGGELTEAGLHASCERYDPETNEWELLPAVRAPVCGAAVAITGACRSAYNLGGLGLSGQALGVAEQLPLMSMLEEGADQKALPNWHPIAPMPTPRHLASAAAFRGGCVAVGGKGATFDAVTDVELYDPDVGAWEVLPSLPYPRLRAGVAGGRL
mmetsp:Transcript_58859/g.151354  ORF Transcript_58859/g.151354 Transcript_58859/m.151354 type:complete len:393 (-) Transcript_58859:77-1255(-)